ncbi:MAG: replication-associated recombination protein A, partial [Actinobacteria bacterium]|nr:replication-associated recombination protein A [Actinomycetota bacterium]
LRASDPDAALYYMAVMIEGGEDPLFIARRLVIFASEDVGNAAPRALEVAVAAAHAVEFVGLPEARLNLAQAVTYLACSPKSNASYVALERATDEVRSRGPLPPPPYLCDRRSVAAAFRSEEEYVYPHDEGGYVAQRCLPPAIQERVFYEPTDQGIEARFREFLKKMRTLRKGGQ